MTDQPHPAVLAAEADLLASYGWNEQRRQSFQQFAATGLEPARIIIQHRNGYGLITGAGEVSAQLSGRLARESQIGTFPVVGDWVAIAIRDNERSATIHNVLPRSSTFTRKVAGNVQAAQIVAANVDVALLVASLNRDLNPRRIERYLATAWESGANPMVVLTKADLCTDISAIQAEIEAIAGGVPVHVVSVVSGMGMAQLAQSFAPGQTAVLLGSSGAGKSSLVNALAGKTLMATRSIREGDARGRHTTTHRHLVLLPNGRLLLDTPGMRELGLWDAESGVTATFADIEELVTHCRFGDCTHGTEPGCAVQAALQVGALQPERWNAYQKLRGELATLKRRDEVKTRAIRSKPVVQTPRGSRAQRRQDAEEE